MKNAVELEVQAQTTPVKLVKRGRPPKSALRGAMTPAQRKRASRKAVHDAASLLMHRHAGKMTEAQCMAILMTPGWREGDAGRNAWLRLGELRGYVTVTQNGSDVTKSTLKLRSPSHDLT